jgi:hypothetical protein
MPVKLAVAGLCLILLGGSTLSSAQQVTGAITGTVKDAQGALVPSANLKASNTDTGFNRAAVSGSDGAFLIPYLPVGKYTVEVTAPGFKKFLQQNLVISVDHTQILNVQLSIGGESQTITVTEAPPLVETTTAELGRTVSPAEVAGLPLVNRNAYAELSLTPGIQSNSASASGNPNGTPNMVAGVPSTQVVINGGIDMGVPMVAYYLDGGLNQMGIRNYGNPVPNPDALQEFRVETNNFSAQYGRMSGAVVTAVTKSGTNQFHGSLFEFNRNTDFNAYNWNATTKAPYHRNQFGGAVGGPIRPNKAFFFFSYAGLRQTVGTFLSGGVLPTALERLGDFSQSKVIPTMPGTSTPVQGTNSSVNCGIATVGCIPSSLLDKVATNLMNKYIPLPNSPGNTYTGYFTGPTNQDEYVGKFDQVVSDKDHITASYFNVHTVQNANGGGNFAYMVNQSYARQQNVNLSDIHTINAGMANQAWITFTRVAGGRVNLPNVGLEDLGSSFTTQGVKTLPQLSVSGYFGVGGSLAGPVTNTDFYSARDMISMSKGKHSLDFGAETSLEKDMLVGNLYNFGVFTFSTSTVGTTKNALADFVTGTVGSMEQDTPYHGLINAWYYGFFFQDNYRIRPHLTMNIGVRYDLETPPVESQNLTLTFKPGVQSTKVPSAPLGLLFVGDNSVPRGITNFRKHHISPRLGIAWDPFGDGKTAVRAGAGVFYGSVSANEWNQPANAQPYAIRQTFSSIASLTNPYGNPASFPNGDPFPYTFNPASPRFLPAASVETVNQNYQWPLAYQLNTAIERQLPGKVSLLTAYVGNLIHRVPFSPDANYPGWAPGASTSQASINARRPYDPGVLGAVSDFRDSQTASYHSLQISARRPLTNNLMLSGFYVFSKSFWSASGSGIGASTAQDFNAMWEERGPSDNDRRHVATISGIWHIDYLKGSGFIARQVLNGWTISPIITLQSGSPVNIVTGSDKNADSIGGDRPNLVPGVSAFLDPHRSRMTAASAWFNTAAFIANGPGVAGGIGAGGADGNTSRDYLHAPGYRDVDLGLFRDLRFERGITLQVRGEATNVFNQVSLSAPTANLSSSLNGHITSASTPRLLQLGMKLSF